MQKLFTMIRNIRPREIIAEISQDVTRDVELFSDRRSRVAQKVNDNNSSHCNEGMEIRCVPEGGLL